MSFYADGALLTTMIDPAAIPNSAAAVHFAHWSNGDPGWSGGPPAEDAVVSVAFFKGYFNISGGEEVVQAAVEGTATRAGGGTPPGCSNVAPCGVPDSAVGGGLGGNETMRGAWFADGGEGKGWDGVGKAPGVKSGAEQVVVEAVGLALGMAIGWVILRLFGLRL